MNSSLILFLISLLSYSAVAQTKFDFHEVLDETKVSRMIINETELRTFESGFTTKIRTRATYAHVDSSKLLLLVSSIAEDQKLEIDYEISQNGLLARQQNIKDGKYGILGKFYFHNGIFEKQETFDSTGNLLNVLFHEYDSQQRLIIDSTQLFNDDEVSNYHTYTHEYKNNLLSLTSYTDSKAGDYTQYYQYDEQENLIYKKRLNADSSFAMGWSYEYNETGFVKNFYVHYPTEESKNWIVSNEILAIDENGNWTSLQQFNHGKLQAIIERIIEYY